MDSGVRSALRGIVESILSGEISNQSQLELRKREVGRIYGLDALPSNADILNLASSDERERLKLLTIKPTRTLSGVAVVAAMTSPAPCPHGLCVPCPGGMLRNSPQSYTGREPAAMRAIQHDYDPYSQVASRLAMLNEIGHPIDKVDLIVMGGTITSRPLGYQWWFVKRCIEAMNDYPFKLKIADIGQLSFRDVALENERASVRNVGTTFETRPDWCGPVHIRNMLLLGGTKVELGVQSTSDAVLEEMRRGHTLEDSISANKLLREAGLKVGFHMMPGLPASNLDLDFQCFRDLFQRDDLRPDYLKIYPALVLEGTELYDQYIRGEFKPLEVDEAAELISKIKEIIPHYTRLQRVQRDIPAHQIVAGVTKSNLRQLAQERLSARGGMCQCIRCREAGIRGAALDMEPSLQHMRYAACGGDEHFLSYEGIDGTLVGFLRLRLSEAARVRELHIYGPMTPLGRRGGWQHRGYGSMLLSKAEEMAMDAGYRVLEVTSGIGARPYYRRRGYQLEEPYMTKELL